MRYVDTWKHRIPEEKLKAYKSLLSEGVITDPHVTYIIETGETDVEYASDLPLTEVKRLLREASQNATT